MVTAVVSTRTGEQRARVGGTARADGSLTAEISAEDMEADTTPETEELRVQEQAVVVTMVV